LQWTELNYKKLILKYEIIKTYFLKNKAHQVGNSMVFVFGFQFNGALALRHAKHCI